MKKIMLAIILSALLVACASACDNTPTTTTNDSYTKETIESAPITTQTVAKSPIPYNGNDNTQILCHIHENGRITLPIADWNETRLVSSVSLSSDTEIERFRHCEKAIAVNNETACLFLGQTNQIQVIKFEKGSSSEMVTSLDVSEDAIGFKANFVNETVGYVFTFKEVLYYGHPRGSAVLSNFFITKDGGKTWNLIDVQNATPIALQEHIRFAKMVSEEVGLISGDIAASCYNFCERTLLTTDGGLNWVNVESIPGIHELPWAIVTDFTKADDAYILTLRYTAQEASLESGTTAEYGYATYQLTDPDTWIRIS